MKRNDPRVVPPQSPTNLNHFYPVAGAAGIRSMANGYTKNLHHKKKGAKIPLIKVLEGS